MWERFKIDREAGRRFSFLNATEGQPRIFERFLANTMAAGFSDRVLPLRLTSLVGMRLLQRLHRVTHNLSGVARPPRLPHVPQIIYLDSAHEAGETLMELGAAWELLETHGGVIFGDDWQWPAVRRDVSWMASCVEVWHDVRHGALTATTPSGMHAHVFGSCLSPAAWPVGPRARDPAPTAPGSHMHVRPVDVSAPTL